MNNNILKGTLEIIGGAVLMGQGSHIATAGLLTANPVAVAGGAMMIGGGFVLNVMGSKDLEEALATK